MTPSLPSFPSLPFPSSSARIHLNLSHPWKPPPLRKGSHTELPRPSNTHVDALRLERVFLALGAVGAGPAGGDGAGGGDDAVPGDGGGGACRGRGISGLAALTRLEKSRNHVELVRIGALSVDGWMYG